MQKRKKVICDSITPDNDILCVQYEFRCALVYLLLLDTYKQQKLILSTQFCNPIYARPIT